MRYFRVAGPRVADLQPLVGRPFTSRGTRSTLLGMIRLEFKEGTSSKFWEIDLTGAKYTVRWGRIGTSGQEKPFSFPNPAKAQAEADKLVAEKKKKGYVEIGGGKAAKGAKAKPAPRSANAARNPELDALLAKDPADAATYAVYGDWLTAQNDPRGELCALQSAYEALSLEARKSPRGKELATKAAAILRKNDRFLPGVPAKNLSVKWRSGFCESVRFHSSEDHMDDDVDVPSLVKRVLASPAIAGIVELEIGILRWDYVAKDVGLVLKAFAESPYAKQIRRIAIGPKRNEEVDTGMYDPGALDRLSGFPGVETLLVHGGKFSFKNLALPNLKELSFETCSFSKARLAELLAAKLPKLERASLWLGSRDYGALWKVGELAPIFDGTFGPKVTHLGLMNAEMTDDICRALGGSKILKRLRSLDLSMGTMMSDGAKALVEAKKAFSHLEALSVDDNHLSKADVALLKRELGSKVFSKSQREADVDEGRVYRYVSVSE